MRKGLLTLMISAPLLMAGCSKKNAAPVEISDNDVFPAVQTHKPGINPPARILLKATAFKMSGDYADKVAVTLNADGTFAYYPAPSDITEASKPVSLGNGWWLNRQGISPKSQFTKYTFEEYAALKETPSQEELMQAIIPGARVTEFEQLPFPATEAMENLEAIKKSLK